MNRTTRRFPLLAAAVVACLPGLAAAETPAEILVKMDKTISGFADQTMESTMTIIDTNGSEKAYDFVINQKGEDKRLVRFTSGEVKDMATLIEDRQHVYAYLPGFKKVRRVATHNMSQSFAGSDYSNEDMATVTWSKTYDCTADHEDEGFWYLACTPKAGVDSEYAKAVLKVNRKSYTQDGIVFFDKSGKKVKSFDQSNPKDFNGAVRNTRILVTDLRTGHKTRLDIHSFKWNQNLPDSMFTQRELEWGK